MTENHKAFMPVPTQRLEDKLDKVEGTAQKRTNPFKKPKSAIKKEKGQAETSQMIRNVFENYAIYRYGNCRLDRNHLLMNSQQIKGAVITLHAILQHKLVRDYLLRPEDHEVINWERIAALFRRYR